MIATTGTKRIRQRGQSLVEFALVIPVFMLVVLSIAEGGYYVVASTSVNHATHEGARRAVLPGTTTLAAVRSRIIDAAGPTVSLSDGDITIKVSDDDGSNFVAPANDADFVSRKVPGARVLIETAYSHVPLVGHALDAVFINANADAELWVEAL